MNMRPSLVVTVAMVIAGCHSDQAGKGSATDAAPEVPLADGAAAVLSLPAEAPGAQTIAPVTIVFENPSSRPLYLLPGCASEFTVLSEAVPFPGRVGRREFCLCECDACLSQPACAGGCAGSKEIPPHGEARLRWIPRSYHLQAQPSFACQRVEPLPAGKYRLWAVVYDSPSLDVGWTGAPIFGVSKSFELPVTGGELRIPLVDPGADGAHCTALAACCPKLPIPEYAATCKSMVVDGVQPRCQELLTSYMNSCR